MSALRKGKWLFCWFLALLLLSTVYRVLILKGVFIVGGKRTPFGSFGGALKNTDFIQLGQIAAKAALESAKLTPQQVDSVIVGNVNQVHDVACFHAN